MDIFEEGFHQADGTPVEQNNETAESSVPPHDGTHEAQQQASAGNLSAHDAHNEHEAHNNHDAHNAHEAHDVDMETPLRGKAATEGMSVDEKKERQKQQNRLAAERSRSKKREELAALEMTVSNIQDENNRLRARLSTLLTVKPEAAPPTADVETANPNVTSSSIDYANLAKLHADLADAKATLLERELELGRLQVTDGQNGDVDDTRRALLSRTISLQAVQSEVRALHLAINHLRTEHESLARQRDVVTRELEARRTLQASANDAPALAAGARANSIERALLELRGIVDGVIKTWDQTSILSSRTGDSNPRPTDSTGEI